jgi:hypothetical protein
MSIPHQHSRDPRPEDFRLPSSGKSLDRAFGDSRSDPSDRGPENHAPIGEARVRGHQRPEPLPLDRRLLWAAAACGVSLLIGVLVGLSFGDDRSAFEKAVDGIQRDLKEIRTLITSQDSRSGTDSKDIKGRLDQLDQALKAVIAERKGDGEK